MQMHRVFVYGTLKRGQANHPGYLAESRFVGEARTAAAYLMHSVGFPLIQKDELGSGGAPVAGEVYEVDDETLSDLDMLEGNGRMYQRRFITLADGTGAWVYEWMGKPRGAPVAPKDGVLDWSRGR